MTERNSSKAQQTRQRILVTAFDYASEHGLESLTIGELAKCVGMSKSGLFSHFQSKENLQISVLQYAGEAFTERVVQPVRQMEHHSVRDKLTALMKQWMAWNHSFQGSCMFLNAWRSGEAPEGEVQNALEQLTSRWLDYLHKQFEAGVAAGEFIDDLDCWQTVYRVYGAYLGSQLFYSLKLETETRDRFWTEVEQIFFQIS